MPNIPINYIVNNRPLLDLNKTLEQLNAAQDKLNASVRNTGQVYSTTLAGMRSRLDTLRAAIENTAQADVARLQKLSAEYKKLDTEINRITADLYKQSQAMDAMGKSAQQTSVNLGNMVTQVKAFLTAGLLKEILDTTLAMAELAGNVEGVSRAFSRLPQSTKLLSDLRRSTHGTLTDLQLMQQAIRAQNFRIPLQDLGMYLEFAMQRAQATGESIDYMVNSIVTGLGRDSIKILDNLQVDIGAMKKDMAELGISIDEAFGIQVRNEMAKMGGFIETQKDQVSRLRTEWETLKVVISQKPATGWLIDFLTQSVQGAQALVKAIDLNPKYLIPWAGWVMLVRDVGRNLGDLAREQAAVNQSMDEFTRLSDSFVGSMADQAKQAEIEILLSSGKRARFKLEKQAILEKIEVLKEDSWANRIQIEEMENAAEHYDVQISMITKLIDLLKEYAEAKRLATKEDVIQKGIIETLNELISDLEEKRTKATSLTAIRRYNDQLALQRAYLQEILGLTDQMNSSASRVYDIRQNPGGGTPQTKTTTETLRSDMVALAELIGREFGKRLGESLNKNFKETGFFEKLIDNMKAYKTELVTQAVDMVAGNIHDIMDLELMSYDMRIQALSDFYDRQYLLAGDNTRKKKELQIKEDKEIGDLRRKQAKAEQRARIFGIIIDTAASISKTAAQLGFPAAIPFIALAAINGAVQLAIASKAKPQGFKDGVIDLPANGKPRDRDSILAMLQPGESVMTVAETKSNKRTLKAMRAKMFDDTMLERLKLTSNGVSMEPMDLTPVVNAIYDSQTDYYAQGTTIMQTQNQQAARRKVHRARSI